MFLREDGKTEAFLAFNEMCVVCDSCYARAKELHSNRAPPNSFIRVHWRHGNAEDPITLFSELDEERWEVRKVEVFADGRIGYANERGSFGMTRLGDQPVPALEVIADNPEFEPVEITRAEFDEIFDKALTAEEVAQF